MTTRGTIPHPEAGTLVDAPTLHLDQMSDRQRADLHPCTPCAATYGVPAVDADQ